MAQKKQFICFLHPELQSTILIKNTGKQINGIKVNKSLKMPYFCVLIQ